MNALKESFDKERIDIIYLIYIKENLVGFGSDGASVNLGRRSGFVKKLDEFVGGRNLYSVWCMLHRLELAIKAAIKENPKINTIDDIITILTKFYNSRSYKRKPHLRADRRVMLDHTAVA